MSAGVWLYIILLILTLLGLLLNVYLLIIVLISKELATGNRLLLLHLSTVNILLCLFFLLLVLPHIISSTRSRPPNPSVCDLQGFLFSLLHSVSIWNVCALNCDRYYAIASPLHYSVLVNQKKIALCLVTTWCLCCLVCLPPFFRIAPYSFDPDVGSCLPDFRSGRLSSLWYSGLFIGSTFLLPAAVILVCNIKVLMIARYHRHRIASAIFEVTLSAQVTITHQKNPFYNSLISTRFLTRRSAYNTVFELLASFILLYLPYYSMILVAHVVNMLSEDPRLSSGDVRPISGENVHNRLPGVLKPVYSSDSSGLPSSLPSGGLISAMSLISFALITSSTLVNSLLYGIKSKVLRKSFQNYWRKQKSKSEIYNEIQARTPSTCGSRRPSLTPLGILTKPAPLIRRSSEIGIESTTHSSHNGHGKSSKKNIKGADRQMSTSTSKLSLSTADKMATLALSSGPGGNHRMSNSVTNINKLLFHLRSHPSTINTAANVTTTSFTSPRILITSTFSQDTSGDEQFASLEPNRSLESATTYDSVQADSDRGERFDSLQNESNKNDSSDHRERYSCLNDSSDHRERYSCLNDSSDHRERYSSLNGIVVDVEKAFDSIQSCNSDTSRRSETRKQRSRKVLSFLSLDNESDDDVTLSKATVSE